MNKTMLSVKINKDLKESAQKVAKDLGLPLSAIINSYLRKLVDERRVEFIAHPAPNRETEKLLLEIDRDIRKRKNLEGPFGDVEDAVKFLNSR